MSHYNVPEKENNYISTEDVYAYGTEYQIPVGFILESCDWITPIKYIEDYFHTMTAPKKRGS